MEEKNKLQSFFSEHYAGILTWGIILIISLAISLISLSNVNTKWERKVSDISDSYKEKLTTAEISYEDKIKKQSEKIKELEDFKSKVTYENWQGKAEFYNKYIVVTTPTGECYHEYTCSYVDRFYVETFKSARNGGYRACSRCNPDEREGLTY